MSTILGAPKHTPGPWRMAGPVGAGIWIQSDTRPNIAAVHGAATEVGFANASLIASAPILLETLEQIVAHEEAYHRGDAHVATLARAALAQAKGEVQS